MEIPLAILFAGFLIFLAHLFAALFDRTRIPDVLMLVVIGLLIGPLTGLVSTEDLGEVGYVFAMITLVIILFESGLGLSFSALRESMGRGTRLAIINFIASLAVVVPLSVLVFDMSVLEGLVLGSIVGAASPAIVVPIVSKLPLKEGSRTALVLESAFSDVLCIVFALGFIQAFEYHAVRPTVILGTAIASVLLAAVIGALAAFFWASVLNRVRQLQNSIFLTPAFVFIVFGVTELLGYSGAISALAFGIVLGNIPSIQGSKLLRFLRLKNLALVRSIGSLKLSEMERAFFAEVVFLLKAFFFVYVGLSICFGDFTLILTALGLTLALFLIRIPVVRLAMDKAIPRFDASVAAVMVPKGLAAAVLATLPLQAGMENGDVIQEVTYAVILFSIIATTVLTFLIEKSKLRQVYTSFLFSKYASETDPKENKGA